MPFVLANHIDADFQTGNDAEIVATSIAIPENSIFAAHLIVMARAASDATGVWELWSAGRRIGAAAAELIGNVWIQADMVQANWVQGPTVQNFAALQDAAWSALVSVNGADLDLKVTGATAQTVNWYMNGDLNTAVPA